MYKIIRGIILLLLSTSKTTATPVDTTYYVHTEELSYDTIPYMMKDSFFMESFNELKSMLNEETPYSLKRAEFLVEWSYSGGRMNYEKFCHDIDSVSYILKRFIEVNNIQQYKTAPNFALFEYFTKPKLKNKNYENGDSSKNHEGYYNVNHLHEYVYKSICPKPIFYIWG